MSVTQHGLNEYNADTGEDIKGDIKLKVLVIAMLYLDYHIFAADGTMNALQILVIAVGIIVAEIFTYAFPMEMCIRDRSMDA